MRNLIIVILAVLLLPLGVNASTVQNVASSQPKRVVVIDPGHGGPRPGKVQRDIAEKDYVLDVSKMVKKRLEEKMTDLDVYLTRSSDSAYHKGQNDDNKLRAQFSNRGVQTSMLLSTPTPWRIHRGVVVRRGCLPSTRN